MSTHVKIPWLRSFEESDECSPDDDPNPPDPREIDRQLHKESFEAAMKAEREAKTRIIAETESMRAGTKRINAEIESMRAGTKRINAETERIEAKIKRLNAEIERITAENELSRIVIQLQNITI